MKRSEGALEVYLANDERTSVLVGWLTNFTHFDHSQKHIEIIAEQASLTGTYDPFDDDDDFVVERRIFVLTSRKLSVDHAYTINEGVGPGSRTHKNVPVGAMHNYHIDKNIDVYTWKVLAVEMADYEWLFELPTFEAFDKTEPFIDDDVKPPTFSLRGEDIADGSITAKTLTVAGLAEVSRNMGPMTVTDHAEGLTYKLIEPRMIARLSERMDREIKDAMLGGSILPANPWKSKWPIS